MARQPRRASYPAPRRGGQGKSFTSKPADISVAGPGHRCVRVDLEIEGIYHGGASYKGLVFLNNPNADAKTPRDLEHGYAGAFNIFGHGGCLGDPGHCEVNEAKRETYDLRWPHPLTPALKRVIVTEAVKDLATRATEATVTIVPVITAVNALSEGDDVFRCSDIRLVTYN